jgi:hypothetical protein
MPTTISTNATFSSVRSAFSAEGYGTSTSFFAYRQGGGIVPDTSTFNVIGAGTQGDPLRLHQFSGFVVPSLVTFSPIEGGTSAGTAVPINADVAYEAAVISIECSVNATWNYTRTFTSGNGNESVSLSSGGVGTTITFLCDSEEFQLARRTWSVNATAGGITRYWTVDLRSDYT